MTHVSRKIIFTPCRLAKAKRAKVSHECKGECGEAFGDEIHSDVWGPSRIETFSKCTYFISYTDDWSCWTTCYLLFSKADVFTTYQSFAAWVSNHLQTKIKCLHSDRSGEYMLDAFITFLDEQGTTWKLTVHDTPEENGVAERLNCTLME